MFFKIIYNFILLPILYFIILLGGLFSSKIRKGFAGRLKSKKILKSFINKSKNDSKEIFWFHAASLGEYEQIKPVLSGLKEIEPNSYFILSLFSPSGYDFIDDEQVDCKVYLPFDSYWGVKSCLKIVKPKKIILAGYDVWPNLIWSAKKLNIHTVLFAARFSKRSTKRYFMVRKFYRNIYNSFSAIYTISNSDNEELFRIIGKENQPIIRILGNPRYDQVKTKSDEFTKERTLSVMQRPKRLIFGSMHNDDEKQLLDSILSLLKDIPDLSYIWAPHNPSKKNIERIENYFISKDITTSRLGNSSVNKIDAKVIIVDSVGRLSQLYWDAQIAYIGGGFSSGIHNVMEPAIARLPVFFGPEYSSFHEAEELILKGGGFSIESGAELYIQVKSLFENSSTFMNASYSATNVVHDNLGSSTRIIRSLIHD